MAEPPPREVTPDQRLHAEGPPPGEGAAAGQGPRSAVNPAVPADTGEPRVDAALAELRSLDGRPVAEHADVYATVHRRLQDALADLDDRA